MIRFLKSLYLTNRLFAILAVLVITFLFSYYFPLVFWLTKAAFFALCILVLIDVVLLYRVRKGVTAKRLMPEKLSNGDQNPLYIQIDNHYPFETHTQIIDELPIQFQIRNTRFDTQLKSGASETIEYSLRPTQRGAYRFGALNVFVASALGLVNRRYRFDADRALPVYPSFIQMQQYELLAISNRLTELGIKKIRRIGHSMEFEQIREYVPGDDYRTVNWKASARKNTVMVNQFQDEKSQQVYSIIDKGRVMKMPFEGLSLLDYAINASLVISNIAIKKGDKAGLISFTDNRANVLKASKLGGQMRKIQERLYKESTRFQESGYEQLYVALRRKLNQRSLLLLYTNFETLSALKRQLPFFRKIAKRHLLVVVFFENTELYALLHQTAENPRQIYHKAIAEKFALEKKLIVKELQMHGIQTILTAPQDLTVNTINKYLELKSRGLI